LHKSIIWEGSEQVIACVSLHQLVAAADPKRSSRELTQAGEAPPAEDRNTGSRGNFQDFDQLFEQLAKAPVIELGNPLPKAKHLPRRPLGSCEAAHNRALLGEDPD
jgi:hypothetical protein